MGHMLLLCRSKPTLVSLLGDSRQTRWPIFRKILPTSVSAAERLLIHSSVSDNADHEWPSQFPYLSVRSIQRFALLDTCLVGLDSHRLTRWIVQNNVSSPYRYRMVNIENLCLRGVPDGDYELVALPET
jgi:hypothetical protein